MNTIKYRIFRKILLYITPAESVKKIYFGPLKGLKWVYSAGYSTYWMGDYENEIADIFIKFGKQSKVIYDLGANIGFYTLLSSKLVGPQGEVYAFEPLPKNVHYLKKHIAVNKLDNVKVFEKAVSDTTGKVKFTNTDNIVANKISKDITMTSKEPTIEVEADSLDNLVKSGALRNPDFIKMDIEGEELNGLKGAKHILEKFHPVILLSTHNCQVEGIHKKCITFLSEIGYRITYIDYYGRETELDDPWYEILAEYN